MGRATRGTSTSTSMEGLVQGQGQGIPSPCTSALGTQWARKLARLGWVAGTRWAGPALVAGEVEVEVEVEVVVGSGSGVVVWRWTPWGATWTCPTWKRRGETKVSPRC